MMALALVKWLLVPGEGFIVISLVEGREPVYE
jgi:hypothetical protein